MIPRSSALIVLGACVAGSCAPGPELGQLKVRASYDMSCSNREDIQVKALDDDTYDAAGCGKRATYAWVCNGRGPMAPCDWVRRPDGRPPAAH